MQKLPHLTEKSSSVTDLEEKHVVKKSSLEVTVLFHKGANRTKCHNSLSSPSSFCKTAELGTATVCIYNCSIKILAWKKPQFCIAIKVLWQTSLTEIWTAINYNNLNFSVKMILVKKLLLFNSVSITARKNVCRLVWREKNNHNTYSNHWAHC